jgi:hypothetical protein
MGGGKTMASAHSTGFRQAADRYALVVLRAGLELTLVFALFQLYRLGRLLTQGHELTARDHAVDVHRLEGLLHLPSEAWLQSVAGTPTVLHLANIYYVSVHFPVMIAFLVWGYLFRPRREYVWARNLVIAMTASALVIHIAFPLAPPRMFGQWGFVDSMTVYGPNPYQGASGAVANQFAAMPSLHVGWALLIAYVVARTGPRWLAMVASTHAVVTVFVVVVTANHWWLDGIVAAALLLLAARVVPLRHLGSRSARASTRAAGAVSRQASKVSSASSSRSMASR